MNCRTSAAAMSSGWRVPWKKMNRLIPPTAVLGIVPVTERHPPALERLQPIVRDRHAVRVPGQVFQGRFGAVGPMPLTLQPDGVSRKATAAGFRWENGQVVTGGYACRSK